MRGLVKTSIHLSRRTCDSSPVSLLLESGGSLFHSVQANRLDNQFPLPLDLIYHLLSLLHVVNTGTLVDIVAVLKIK